MIDATRLDAAITNWFAPAISGPDRRVLVYGCGDGSGVEKLVALGFAAVTGIDTDAAKIAAGRARGLDLVAGDLFDVLDREFDYVFASSALLASPGARDAVYLLRSVTRAFIFYCLPIGEGSATALADPGRFLATLDGLHLPHKSQEVTGETRELWGIIGCAQERSDLRRACDAFVRDAAALTRAEVRGGRLLYVGTAGDPIGGEYTAYFPGFERRTADADPHWAPDIVCDITATGFPDASWDVVVCSNVIEHVPDLTAISAELARIIRPGGHLLIDCPWSYPYHAEPPSFGDYWRISLDGFGRLFGGAFYPLMMEQKASSTHALFRRMPPV